MTSSQPNWFRERLRLRPRARGFHLVTDEIVGQLDALTKINIGILNLFIQHTSASLTINENADPTVRADLESHINQAVPENAAYYLHNYEGSDDMPAHIKASVFGSNLTIPIQNGRLALGTWQGIYLGEHRNHGGERCVIATITGL
ncbi:secondary thiamine-phosphate synthase enzyme YjbQ [Paraglaciecola mesophila]|uniref:secondary thiamine-phosphate synthase enzyme YjbQ n=1 Tax=Paraglaciecola mesophila TaxID=197222 RepID=UPI001363848D|nr:secondary thiamine-phosphate synthase enzyme YjbQ [Paraglaciecola mesophila]